MKHRATPRFWRCFEALPEGVQASARQCYRLLKQHPRHPSLQLKTVGRFWSVRIGIRYRALAVEQGADRIWFWMGTHAEYDKLVSRA